MHWLNSMQAMSPFPLVGAVVPSAMDSVGRWATFPVDRIEVSLGLGYWSMEDTGLVQVTPGARLITELGGLRPYVGVFYRRWYFSSDAYDDTHSAGSRVGTFFQAVGGPCLGLASSPNGYSIVRLKTKTNVPAYTPSFH